MAISYYNISLHHLANHLIHLSSSSSFWFSLNSSYDNQFHLSKQLGTSCPASCCIASLCPLVVPPSCPAPSIVVALALAPSIACRRCAVRHRAAAATTAATKLLLPSCRCQCTVTLPPPPPPPPPRRRSLVGCCIVVRRPIPSSHAVMRPPMLSLPAAFADNCLPPLPLGGPAD